MKGFENHITGANDGGIGGQGGIGGSGGSGYKEGAGGKPEQRGRNGVSGKLPAISYTKLNLEAPTT